MNARNLTKPALIRAFGSILFTLGVWGWMLTRAEGTFHDQGGMAITFIYFPATFLVWLYCGLTAVVCLVRGARGGSEGEVARVGRLGPAVFGLMALGLLLSVGTLFVA